MNRIYIFLFATLLIPNLISAQCFKTSLYFDGVYNAESTSNDHVDISTYGPMSTIESGVSYTIEAWVKRDRISNPGGYERILSKDFIYQFRIIDNQFVGEIGTSSVQTPYPADTLWHHLAFVRNAAQGTLILFIDGQLRATAPDNSTSLPNNNAMVCIGARNNGAGEINELWKGNIRWMRVSKVARYLADFTPTETYVTDSQTLAVWPLNEGYGTSLNDPAGYNTGKIVNATWITESPTFAPILSAQSTAICAGISTRLTASNCTGSVAWGTGETGSSITVTPYTTTTYAARCVSPDGCPSNAAEITINVEGVMPTISISADPGTFIQKGETVTFTANITNGGTTPVYQWRKNGVVVGTNGPSYTDAQLNSGDSIRCILTSNAPCLQLDKVISNELTIQIPELVSEGACGEASLTLNDLPYTEIRWKKDGQYIENPVTSNRGGGVTVAGGNPQGITVVAGSIFVDEANAVYTASNMGILKIEASGREKIVIPSTRQSFLRARDGRFYVPFEDRVEKWEIGDTLGTVVAGGNGIGSNANQLSLGSPVLQTVQVTEAGIIYVLDRGNNRIQRWNPGASEGITVAQGNKVDWLFFVDAAGSLFTASEGTIYKWPANSLNAIPLYNYPNITPLALQGDTKGNLYIPIYDNSLRTQVYRLNENGIIEIFRLEGNHPSNRSIIYSIAISLNGEIHLNADIGGGYSGGVFKYSSGFYPQLSREKYISSETNMVSPNDVFVNENGEIFTAGEDRVQKWLPDSKVGITLAGGNGLGNSSNQLNNATDVAEDNEGNIYVVDKNNHRVQRFGPGSSIGVTMAGGNGPGSAANQLNYPNRFFQDQNKNLFIADGSRVQKWANNSTSGITVVNAPSSYIFVREDTIYAAGSKWGPGVSTGVRLCGISTNYNSDIYLDSKKNILFSYYDAYRTTIYNSSIRRWSPTNEILNGCLMGKIDTLTQSVYTPTGIFIDSLNNLYVADNQRKKIQKFLGTAPTLAAYTSGQYTAEVTIGSRTLTLSAIPGSNVLGLCESTGSGDWGNAATWTCGRVPLACDQVVINTDHTIALADTVQIAGLEIRQNGNLSLMGGNVQIAKP
ncbi:LamG-like jellyroll fold domain-containing protein [Salmonirosea aquatica]|uniref:Ig-like domain-containing protein n=1 Tax=Salmonirosea aquatica TaxID=2654236 RepID=A0A7C9F7E5_9BACT|nr:hypothetical protein [Cytophagaceae bacterium SJW1-29]